MKKVIVLAATALLLAGCSATASSAPPASSAPAATAASASASAEASSAPAAGGSNAADPAGYPALSLEETCTKFIDIFSTNKPAQGSVDNQKYWATIRDALVPVRAGAAAETKADMEGIFTFYDTRAEHWEPTIPEALGKAATPFLSHLAVTCTPYAPKK